MPRYFEPSKAEHEWLFRNAKSEHPSHEPIPMFNFEPKLTVNSRCCQEGCEPCKDVPVPGWQSRLWDNLRRQDEFNDEWKRLVNGLTARAKAVPTNAHVAILESVIRRNEREFNDYMDRWVATQLEKEVPNWVHVIGFALCISALIAMGYGL